MPKCLECGFEAPRLQWTHFKYRCTGKFSNGREYLKTYPNATVVDDDLRAQCSATQDNFIRKHGPVEGAARWEKYRERQSYTNSFEHKQKQHGWTREQFNEYNKSRSQTLEKMIQRHGEQLGIEKWHDYCERQAYTNTRDYFIKKYGPDQGIAKYLEVNRRKSVANPLVLSEKLQVSLDQAVGIVCARQHQFYSNIEKEFTDMLRNRIGDLEHSSDSKPFGRWCDALNSYVVYDIKHLDCIIEFNGDYWHANPSIYKETAVIRGKTAKDIWHRDMLKLQTVKDLEFRTMTVWESDFRRNKQTIVNEVASWILNEPKSLA